MDVNNKMIDKLAHLARLEFNDAEREAMKSDFTKMLDFVSKLEELDTDQVEPLVYMSEEVNVLRKDQVKQSISQEEALKNSPQKDSDYMKVPTVMTAKKS